MSIDDAIKSVAEKLAGLSDVAGELNHRNQVLENDIERAAAERARAELDYESRINAITLELASAREEIARLKSPGDRIPFAAVEDLWTLARLRLVRADEETRARWADTVVLVERQMQAAAASGGVRKGVAWIAEVIAAGIADKIVTADEVRASGIVVS